MAVDKIEKRDLVLQMWSQNIAEEIIAKTMKMSVKQVHDNIYNKGVNLVEGISNEEDLVRLLEHHGHSEVEIATIMEIDVDKVHGYLERQKR
jgi:DNA-binding CsgD family transcriptional regulator